MGAPMFTDCTTAMIGVLSLLGLALAGIGGLVYIHVQSLRIERRWGEIMGRGPK